ncbi:MAG: hypothetical protein AAFU85_33260, partial [Planctomycetota bacterium]
MFSPDEVNRLSFRRAWILFPGALLGVLATLAAIALLAGVRDPIAQWVGQRAGASVGEAVPVLLMLPTIAPFLAILMLGEQKAKRFALVCPVCGTDESRASSRVLATRSCSSCEAQIIEGPRTRATRVYQRYCRLKQRQFLIYWLWVWPAFGLSVLAVGGFYPAATHDCPQILW